MLTNIFYKGENEALTLFLQLVKIDSIYDGGNIPLSPGNCPGS